ncbi:hypothetical protein [Rothia sp. P4278]|uniref:hypothetical protein n=1 Tax=Rothia sp. P4278 TaxID=3402658 RepID=UPI003AEEE0E3
MASKWDDIDSGRDLDAELDALMGQGSQEFDGDLTDVSGEQTSGGDSGQLYDPPALKMADAANLRDIHPFLGYAWREIDDDLRRDAWVWLRGWVDWFAVTYKVDKKLLPGCWFLHSDVVEFLWVGANAEVKAWHNPDASLTPFTAWHAYYPGLIQRLAGCSQVRCRNGEHQVEQQFNGAVDPNAIDTDEWAWQRLLHQVTDVNQQVSAGSWRAVLVTKDGTEVRSEKVEVPEKALPFLHVTEPVVSFSGEGAPVLSVQVSGADLSRTFWEYQDSYGAWHVDEFSVRSVEAGEGKGA